MSLDISASFRLAYQDADALMRSAADSIAQGDLGDYVDAFQSMRMAKLKLGIGVALQRQWDDMLGTTLNLLA